MATQLRFDGSSCDILMSAMHLCPPLQALQAGNLRVGKQVRDFRELGFLEHWRRRALPARSEMQI